LGWIRGTPSPIALKEFETILLKCGKVSEVKKIKKVEFYKNEITWYI